MTTRLGTPSKICILCREEMKSPFDKFNVFAVKFHYTSCYIAQGMFSKILTERGVNLMEEERKYYCPECPLEYRRRLYGREYAIHIGVQHGKTRELMAEDRRPGMRQIFEICFPSPQRGAVSEGVPAHHWLLASTLPWTRK